MRKASEENQESETRNRVVQCRRYTPILRHNDQSGAPRSTLGLTPPTPPLAFGPRVYYAYPYITTALSTLFIAAKINSPTENARFRDSWMYPAHVHGFSSCVQAALGYDWSTTRGSRGQLRYGKARIRTPRNIQTVKCMTNLRLQTSGPEVTVITIESQSHDPIVNFYTISMEYFKW